MWWEVAINLPKSIGNRKETFTEAVMYARELLDNGAIEVVLEGVDDTYVMRKLQD